MPTIIDVAHKTAAAGLIGLTIYGLVDVSRGFSILVKRNIDRKHAAKSSEMEKNAHSPSTAGPGPEP